MDYLPKLLLLVVLYSYFNNILIGLKRTNIPYGDQKEMYDQSHEKNMLVFKTLQVV